MESRLSTFANGYVLLLFSVQTVGWIGLVATLDHSPGPVVGWVQTLPGVVRIPLLSLAVFSIPALGLALVAGRLLSLAGLPPESIPPLLVAHGDVLVFASAYVVAVGCVWAVDRIAGSA